jgi:feruloyl esterase
MNRIFLVLFFCFNVSAQRADFLAPPPGEQPLPPKGDCADLRRLTSNDMKVIAAETVPAGSEAQAHCRVQVHVQPAIEIEVALPATWNRRFQMAGNGGFGGDSPASPAKVKERLASVRRGFVWAASNTGHDAREAPQADFAADRQKLDDWAFRSLHVTVETARRLMEAYYGTLPSHSYYAGCSGGGRQGLILAQRYPEDFDGIAVTAPFLNVTDQMLRNACDGQALAESPVPQSKQQLLAKTIYAKCDPADGLKDGIISNPAGCGFDAEHDLPRCAAGTDKADCFTDGQIHALSRIYTSFKVANGRVIPPWPVGAESDDDPKSGWNAWRLEFKGKSKALNMAESFFQYAVPAHPDPEWSVKQFEPVQDAVRIQRMHPVVDATDPDLSVFQKRGGKLILAQGLADQALNPNFTIQYYEEVRRKMGSTADEFTRFYLIPGMYHCGGGPGVTLTDPLSLLVQWVERKTPPANLMGKHIEDGKVSFTRPICAYPSFAKYNGSGSVQDGANFSCVTN